MTDSTQGLATANPQTIDLLVAATWGYYDAHGRDLPWRQPAADGVFDPYAVLVSEVMLQQTQVTRVIPKYHDFLAQFPDVSSLAAAELGHVLRAWSGLGYNRRGKYIWLAAQEIVARHGGVVPSTEAELSALPGIGKNTAGAVCAYGFGEPAIFIETNIRTVFIHHCFADGQTVSDAELLPLIGQALPSPQHASNRNREWYWALMDYGSYLKAAVGNVARQSKHYTKQSPFEGSLRQARGEILRLLAVGRQTRQSLIVSARSQLSERALNDLTKENLVQTDGTHYWL